MNFLETAAHAAEAGGGPGMFPMDFLLIGAFIAIFYFLLWRPQSKRRKEHQALMAGLAKGDEVVTSGGVAGTLTKVEEDFVKVKVGRDVELRVQKQAVSATLPKGTLRALEDKSDKSDKGDKGGRRGKSSQDANQDEAQTQPSGDG